VLLIARGLKENGKESLQSNTEWRCKPYRADSLQREREPGRRVEQRLRNNCLGAEMRWFKINIQENERERIFQKVIIIGESSKVVKSIEKMEKSRFFYILTLNFLIYFAFWKLSN